MRVLAIVHQRDAGPGVFAEAIDAAGARLDTREPGTGPPVRSPAAYDAVLTFGGSMHPDQGQSHGCRRCGGPAAGPALTRVRSARVAQLRVLAAAGRDRLGAERNLPAGLQDRRASVGNPVHAEVTAADLDGWIEDYRSDEDAVAIGLDPAALRHECERKIAGWNELGRELCDRFLAVARAGSAA